jgi:leucyl aminopeptidase (aminopeptidase T)
MISRKSKLERAASVALRTCMGLKKDESLLVVYDARQDKIAKSIFNAGCEIGSKADLLKIKELKVNGEEPCSDTASKMLEYDVIMLVTSKSLSHTKARREACSKGARIASMPGITDDMFVRTMAADYFKIKNVSDKIKDVLSKAKTIRILTSKGTDLTMEISGRRVMSDSGIYHSKGDFGNLPAGETCLAPVEGSTKGVLAVDASFLEKVDKPIFIKIREGYAVSIDGGETAQKLSKILANVHDKNAYAVAELGIGTNDAARISGRVLEDEKVLGTAHIAFGNNKSYGGYIDVPIHLDGVFHRPDIIADGKKIIKNGKLLI